MLRTVVLTVAWVVLASSPASAQSWIATVFPEQSFDFGTVARGSKLRHSFRIVNTTEQEIHIESWQAKCGCTDVHVGAREIPPGTQTVIDATIDTSRFEGYKPSGLTLVLDRPSYAVVDLHLTCFIRTDILLNPGQFDFGAVARKSKPTLTMTLTYAGGQPDWQVTKMQTISAYVTAQLRDIGSSPGGQVRYQITATLNPSVPNGIFKDEVVLLTNDASSPRIPISVSANVQSAVTISPSIVNLGRVRAGSVVKKSVLLRSAKPFKVTDIESKSADMTAAATGDTARPLQTVVVTFKAPNRHGPYNAVLEIATDVEDEPTAKLTAFATIVP
jgi:uncharacterized protein DUF1573